MTVTRRRFVVNGLALAGLGAASAHSEGNEMSETDQRRFELRPVGRVEKHQGYAELRIFDEYSDALLGLDGYSHAFVMYWFDKNDTPDKRSVLRVHPRGKKSNPLTGIFACRSPARPNLIALSLCRIVSVEGSVVRVDKIDAFDGTPILDIKAYIPGIDRPGTDIKVPNWLGADGSRKRS